MPIKPETPIVCYVTRRLSLRAAEPTRALKDKIRLSISAGADWVQIREKDMPGKELLSLVAEMVSDATPHGLGSGPHEMERGAKIIVNDRLDVAIAAGAAGAHLGGDSLPVREACKWRAAEHPSEDFLIGASCHSLAEAREAEASGANYIFFGPVFESPDKLKFGPPQGLESLREVCRAVNIRVIAIGGVNETTAADCLRAGAAGIAAIRLFQESRDEEELRGTLARLRHLRRK